MSAKSGLQQPNSSTGQMLVQQLGDDMGFGEPARLAVTIELLAQAR